MKMKILPAVFCGVLAFNTCLAIDTSVETKISLERSLEDRLHKVLMEITGTDQLIVIVNVDLYSEKDKQEIAPKREENREILPGVPIKESIAEKKLEDLLAPLDLGKTKTLIKNINATIILDRSIPKPVIEIAKKVTTGLLGLNAERGDRLILEQIEFQKSIFKWNTLLYPPNIFFVIAIFLGTVFVLGSLLFIFNPFKIFSRSLVDVISGYVAHLRETQSADMSFGRQGPEITENAAPDRNNAGARETPEERKPFWFIKTEDISQVTEILKTQPPENIIAVLNYLDHAAAARVFNTLPEQVKYNITGQLAYSRQMNPEEVKMLEKKLKEVLDYSVKGEPLLSSLLDNSGKEEQVKILESVSSGNPELAMKLGKNLFAFEDIANFEPQYLQAIIRRVNLAAFAKILKSTREDVRAKIFSALSEGAKKRIQQEMDLGAALTKERVEEEKIKVSKLVKQMLSDGIIQLGRK